MIPVIHTTAFDYTILSSIAKSEVFKHVSTPDGYLKRLFVISV